MPYTISGRAYLANGGEIFAWLSETPEAAESFAQWYNRTARELGVDRRPVSGEDVTLHAKGMERLSAVLLGEMIALGTGEGPI